MNIVVGARSSNLSKIQVQETLQAIQKQHPDVQFEPIYFQTTGDLDQQTSLRELPQNDFFTKELDEALVNKTIRLGIHSAKDLPLHIPEGLSIAAITQGLDPRDALVMREGDALASSPRIATSSARRDAAVRTLFPDAQCVDIRGTIEQRLQKLFSHEVDAVVIAEAALQRLRLTHLNRILLANETVPLQGKLAVLCRSDDEEMKKLFSSIDSRKKVLYTGLDLPQDPYTHYIHYPLIQTTPTPFSELREACAQYARSSHVIITSKTAARYFFELCHHSLLSFSDKLFIAVGKKTKHVLEQHGVQHILTAEQETSEGVVALIEKKTPNNSILFWPHSEQSRDVIASSLHNTSRTLIECILYTTKASMPKTALDTLSFDELFFSSPSTVDAYISFFGVPTKPCSCQGEVTKRYLRARIEQIY
jgi:hydroxymethylbilane synthase